VCDPRQYMKQQTLALQFHGDASGSGGRKDRHLLVHGPSTSHYVGRSLWSQRRGPSPWDSRSPTLSPGRVDHSAPLGRAPGRRRGHIIGSFRRNITFGTRARRRRRRRASERERDGSPFLRLRHARSQLAPPLGLQARPRRSCVFDIFSLAPRAGERKEEGENESFTL